MSDLENALRESLHRRAAEAPDAAPASVRLLGAVRRRRALNSALFTAATVAAVLAVVLGVKLVTPRPIEPVLPPEPRSAPSMAYVGTDGSIRGRDTNGSTNVWVDGPRLRDLCGVPCFPAELAWSPDGRTLAVLTGPACCLESTQVSVLVMSAGGADARRVFQCPDGTGCSDGLPYRLAWSRDSRSIAFSTTRELYVVPRDGGAGDLVCTCGAFGLAFLPDGRLTYVDHGAIKAVDLSSGNASTLARYTGATDAAWSPDGRYAVVTTDDTSFSVVDFSMSPPAQVQPRHVAGLFVRWSPSGDRFVYVASIGHTYRTVRSELWVAAPGQRPRMLHRFPHVAGGLAPPVWSPDGSTLELYQGNGNGADGTISLVDATTGDVVGTVSGAEGGAAWQRAPGSTE